MKQNECHLCQFECRRRRRDILIFLFSVTMKQEFVQVCAMTGLTRRVSHHQQLDNKMKGVTGGGRIADCWDTIDKVSDILAVR